VSLHEENFQINDPAFYARSFSPNRHHYTVNHPLEIEDSRWPPCIENGCECIEYAGAESRQRLAQQLGCREVVYETRMIQTDITMVIKSKEMSYARHEGGEKYVKLL
jgi:hypothetical protein